MLEELAEVLSRPKFDKKIEASRLSVSQLIELYIDFSIVVRPLPTPRLTPDPDDDVVIGTALAAKADIIVTGDRALLSVVHLESVKIVTLQDAVAEFS